MRSILLGNGQEARGNRFKPGFEAPLGPIAYCPSPIVRKVAAHSSIYKYPSILIPCQNLEDLMFVAVPHAAEIHDPLAAIFTDR